MQGKFYILILIGMVLISLFEGVGIFLLIPLISLSGIVDVRLEEDSPISAINQYFSRNS